MIKLGIDNIDKELKKLDLSLNKDKIKLDEIAKLKSKSDKNKQITEFIKKSVNMEDIINYFQALM